MKHHDLSMLEAIEANTSEFLLTMGRLGGGEEHISPDWQWSIGGSPLAYHNCVVRARLTAEAVDGAIATSIKRLQENSVPGSWHVGPWMSPADLGERLVAHGFTCEGAEAGMAVDLLELNTHVSFPSDFSVERVRDEGELVLWTRTLGQGFGEGEIEADWVGSVYRKLGFAEDGRWHHYLGWLRGEPVATTSLFLGAGVAGIYFVFTIPEARRQGIGAAITLAALQEARRRGYRIGVLEASAMGYPIYKRLGFQEYCQIAVYEWLPAML